MSNSYQEEIIRIQAVLDFIWDYEENPEKYGLLTPDVLWNLMEWNVEEENQDDGVITQDASKLDDFGVMPDEEYFDYLDRVSGLDYQISEMGLGNGTTEFIELDFVRNEGDFKEKLNRAGRRT